MTGASTSPRSAPSGMSIGTVLARLKPEFPDLTISKIRFLESEELVTPDRTQSGYRQFSGADIARLRYILTAQRDHYLPLKVIKEQLDAIDDDVSRSVAPPRPPRPFTVAPSSGSVSGSASGSVSGSQPEAGERHTRLTREQLIADSGLGDDELRQAESFGLISAASHGYFDADAMLAARTVADLLALGVEPRHLRTLQSTAQREAAMVAQLVTATARKRDPDARARARADAASHAATLLRLHALLVKSALGRELGA